MKCARSNQQPTTALPPMKCMVSPGGTVFQQFQCQALLRCAAGCSRLAALVVSAASGADASAVLLGGADGEGHSAADCSMHRAAL